ncbi:uncharacterized protein BDR25DRAFT_355485 [Lindgomyces ingoldianus]|uniref:Uncharacterized protein n=1 Tax=Lindgomyces ingoldianus TaxID=673940 RepID=A0ACB6QTW2_9PLEO|nr:uncharacterized protein BDR25DRAFT_355485 [Lindgomyces ingoldianus]KAF2470371.1 hypothetical protein BDR25DRAFT_355485 [Lindgomyces ingoldianus]
MGGARQCHCLFYDLGYQNISVTQEQLEEKFLANTRKMGASIDERQDQIWQPVPGSCKIKRTDFEKDVQVLIPIWTQPVCVKPRLSIAVDLCIKIPTPRDWRFGGHPTRVIGVLAAMFLVLLFIPRYASPLDNPSKISTLPIQISQVALEQQTTSVDFFINLDLTVKVHQGCDLPVTVAKLQVPLTSPLYTDTNSRGKGSHRPRMQEMWPGPSDYIITNYIFRN